MYRQEDFQEPTSDRKSSSMATAAMIFGILSLISGCCFYLSIPFGALGILFAILSKGDEKNYPPSSKNALFLSVFALVIVFTMNLVILAMNWSLIQDLATEDSLRQDLEEILDGYYEIDNSLGIPLLSDQKQYYTQAAVISANHTGILSVPYFSAENFQRPE